SLENLDGRGLAGAIGSQEPEDLAARDREVDAAQRLVVSVALAKAGDGDRGQSSTSTTAPAANEVSRPASSSTISLQSGWCPTTITVSPRPATSSRTAAAVAPGARRSSASGSRPAGRAISE